MNARTVVDTTRMPRVAAVVLNWCNERDTAACLRSLRASDCPALEILLVDNGSPDGSGDRLHRTFADLDFLQTGRNLGYTGGNNRGIEWALAQGADFVLILNNDTELDARCISELLDAVTSVPHVGAVGPKILYADEPQRIWFGGGEISRLRAVGRHRQQGELDSSGMNEEVEEVSFLTGCCLLIPAAVLREIGGFEEDFFAYIEDVDLSVRLTAAGYRLMYQPAARVFHREPVSQAAPSAFQILHRDRNRRRFVRRRYTMPARVAFALFFYPSRIARAVEYFLRGDTDRVRAIWHGMTAR